MELARARIKYGTHQTIEHSLAVLWEEFEELKKEIFKKASDRCRNCIETEAVQVAAMAIRLVSDMELRFKEKLNETD